MVRKKPENVNGINAIHEMNCPDYAPKKVNLPVKESFFVQTGRGHHIVDTHMATVGKIGLLRLGINVEAVGINVFNPDYVSFSLPLSWSGDYFVNGELANRSSIYMPGSLNSFHFRSRSRDTIGVTMPRSAFVNTVAALRGVDGDDISLSIRELRLSESAGWRVRSRLSAIIKETCDERKQRSQKMISEDVVSLLADAYLVALPKPLIVSNRIYQPGRIVRLAEERFMAAEGAPISLADLCVAAGVGKTTLYKAFNQVCGLPPLDYFQKRRFMRARSLLINTSNHRGRVRQIALTSGFTELGRFSVQCRALFGESPSVTLSQDSD